MEYLKLFENHTEYEEYKNSGFTMPNVSHCIENIHIHHKVEDRVIVTYNVTDTSNPTLIGYGDYINGFSAIEIDGIEQPNVVSAYTFDTLGKHIVKYSLKDTSIIDDNAFRECGSITNVIIPNNVKKIDAQAFQDCANLVSINIPSGVTSIDVGAFRSCVGLTSIDIPNTVTSIGNYAFYNCTNLTSIDIPSGVTSIGTEAFYNCTSLTSCTFGQDSQLTSIWGGAFKSCSSLTSIDIPNSVTSIGGQAFRGCSGLTSIDIPSGVTYIGDWSFGGCYGLTNITVDSSNTVYDSRNNCNAIIDTNTNTLLFGCNNTIIPDGIVAIGDNAFHSYRGLTSINIPSSTTSIGNGAFTTCKSLSSITCNAIIAPNIVSRTFENIKSNGTLYVPQGSNGYDVWMQNENFYLGLYGWTKVEQ